MVEKAKSQELSQQIEDLRAELVDLEHELTAGSFSLARFQESDEDMQYYTGFPSMAVFDLCAEFLELEHGLVLGERSRTEGRQRETGGGRKPKFNLREQFFMTVVRLRHGGELRMLGHLYNSSESAMSRIFKAMVNYMYLRLGMLPIWPAPDHVKANLPPTFAELHPSTVYGY